MEKKHAGGRPPSGSEWTRPLNRQQLAAVRRWVKEENVTASECSRRLGYKFDAEFRRALSRAGYVIETRRRVVRKKEPPQE